MVPNELCNVINSQEYNSMGGFCAWSFFINSPLYVYNILVKSSYLLWCKWQIHIWIFGETNQMCSIIWRKDVGIMILVLYFKASHWLCLPCGMSMQNPWSMSKIHIWMIVHLIFLNLIHVFIVVTFWINMCKIP
jgi:hypothetical protein